MDATIEKDEVILYQGRVGYNENVQNTLLTLTSKKMIFEKEKGLLKKQKELLSVVNLNEIKIFNGEVQCKMKLNELQIQTVNDVFSIYFIGIFDAKKAQTKIIDVLTGTTMSERGSVKVRKALDLVNNATGVDTRGVVNGFLDNGIKGTIINGIKKRKK